METLRMTRLINLLVSMMLAFALGLSATATFAQGHFGAMASGLAPSGEEAAIPAGHYAVIASRADDVLAANTPPTMFAEDLYNALEADPESFFVIDIRSTGSYCAGHIPGAVNIPYRTTAMPENLAMLPTDKPILVVCNTGHTASQVSMLYNLLGYESYALRFAMLSWVYDSETKVSASTDTQTIYGGDYGVTTGCAP
jgi:rhodanese-related sulfurtransferase